MQVRDAGDVVVEGPQIVLNGGDLCGATKKVSLNIKKKLLKVLVYLAVECRHGIPGSSSKVGSRAVFSG